MLDPLIKNALDAHGEAISGYINGNSKRLEALEYEVLHLKDGGVMGFGGANRKTSFADLALREIESNRESLSKTGRLGLQLKAATDLVTTANAASVMSGGVGSISGAAYGIQNTMLTIPMTSAASVVYSRAGVAEGAASAQQGEGAAKSAFRPVFTQVTQSALTVAGYANISKQALNSGVELRSALDVAMRRGLNLALDVALIGGNTTPAWAGLDTLATQVSSSFEALPDAVSDAIAQMQEAGHQPTHIVMRPSAWLAIVTATETGGAYLSGNYLGAPEMMLRGLPVVLSASVPAGCAFVLDQQQCVLGVTENVSLTIGYTGTQFTENEATLLAEVGVIPMLKATGAISLAVPFGVSI